MDVNFFFLNLTPCKFVRKTVRKEKFRYLFDFSKVRKKSVGFIKTFFGKIGNLDRKFLNIYFVSIFNYHYLMFLLRKEGMIFELLVIFIKFHEREFI